MFKNIFDYKKKCLITYGHHAKSNYLQLALWGRLAQLGERHVYTVDVGGSNPSPPTTSMGV